MQTTQSLVRSQFVYNVPHCLFRFYLFIYFLLATQEIKHLIVCLIFCLHTLLCLLQTQQTTVMLLLCLLWIDQVNNKKKNKTKTWPKKHTDPQSINSQTNLPVFVCFEPFHSIPFYSLVVGNAYQLYRRARISNTY